MSLICLGVVENIRSNNVTHYIKQLESFAVQHKRGIKFFVDWSEPLASHIPRDSFVINISDCSESNNCELLLLPDGWYFNGQTNTLAFSKRIEFLLDVCSVFIKNNHSVALFLGQSGTSPEEFSVITLKIDEMLGYLEKTIGVYGIDGGICINIIP